MAEERDGQERSEQATPKRVEEARRQGQVVRSRELTSMLLLLGSGGVLLLVGERLVRGISDLMRQLFTLSTRDTLASMSLQQVLIDGLWSALVSVMPLLAACTLISLLAPIAVGGWNWSSEALAPKWSRLDPLAGMMRMFSSQSLVEAAKSVLKLLLVLLALGALLWTNLRDLMALEHMDAQRSFSAAIHLTLHGFLFLAATTVVIAFFDVPWQLFSHAKQMRMSKQEVREEMKETEGKPEIKARIRRMQQELASRRMMEEVPKADVIVTNPSHYAVALRYNSQENAAPVLVAKGADEVAQRIIRIGEQHKVMTFSAPPLARAIFHNTRVGSEIPTGLYIAVARVLAYVFQLRAKAGARDVSAPKDLPIPEELRRDA